MHEPLSETAWLPGQFTNTGSVVSSGITSNEHDVAFPFASVAVIVTVVVPVIIVPATGDCTIVIEPPGVQLSVAEIENNET